MSIFGFYTYAYMYMHTCIYHTGVHVCHTHKYENRKILLVAHGCWSGLDISVKKAQGHVGHTPDIQYMHFSSVILPFTHDPLVRRWGDYISY